MVAPSSPDALSADPGAMFSLADFSGPLEGSSVGNIEFEAHGPTGSVLADSTQFGRQDLAILQPAVGAASVLEPATLSRLGLALAGIRDTGRRRGA